MIKLNLTLLAFSFAYLLNTIELKKNKNMIAET